MLCCGVSCACACRGGAVGTTIPLQTYKHHLYTTHPNLNQITNDHTTHRSHKAKAAKAHAPSSSSAGLGDLSRLAETEEERAARKAGT